MASAAEQILAAIGGGLGGYYEDSKYREATRLKEREIDNRAEINRLNSEIRLMIAQMNEGGRAQRHETPSGNVIAQQEGQNTRTAANNETRVYLGDQRNATTRRGQDLYNEQATMRDLTQRRGQDFQFDLGVMRDNTSRRGQDITSATTRRGQDITEQLGMNAETGRNNRATTATQLRREEMGSREKIAASRNRDPWSSVTFDGPPADKPDSSTGARPNALPVEVREAPLENTAVPNTVRSPEATPDEMARLEQQARSLLAQFQKEADPAKKAALRTQLQALRDRLAGTTKKPGGV